MISALTRSGKPSTGSVTIVPALLTVRLELKYIGHNMNITGLS